MGQRIRRRQNDHRAARPTHSPLSHRGDGQRVVSLPTQQYRSQAAHQGAGTNAARQDDTVGELSHAAPIITGGCQQRKGLHLSTADRATDGLPSLVNIQSARVVIIRSAPTCFTVLKFSSGGRARAGMKYKIEESVLRKLSELSSLRGDTRTARKMAARMRPLSGAETAWIQEAIKQIIWRVGDQRPIAVLPTITM